MDARALFSQLEYNSGEFPEDVLDDAIDQWESILPLLLEELRRAAADPVGLFDKGESYIRHIYATYLLAQFREAAAYPLLVDFVATPGEIVMELMGDVVTEDLGRMLASLCHGDPELIKRLIEEPEVNEWVRSAALDALLVLFGLGQLERDDIMGYLGELFRLKIERKPDYIWSSMVNMACDLYPGELMEEIRQAYDQGLVNPGDVNYREVEAILKLGKGETLEATLKHQRGLIGNVTDEIGWWACFGESNEEDNLDMDSFVLEDDDYSPAVETVVRSGPKIGRNDPCPCGSGKKYKHCCLTRRADPRQPGLAQSVLDEITEAAAQQPVATLDELNALATRAMNQRNRSALAEFCGLNPDQMTCMLYEPFTSPDTVCFSTGVQPVNKTGIMRVFIALVEAIGEDGLKATATGNLPLKFCKALAQQLREEDDNDDRLLLIGGIRSEKDLGVLHCTRLVAQLAGLIRKYRGKFVLTRKCRDMLASEDYGSLYFELFKAYSRKFNWGYRDGYPEAGIVQLSFLYTLFLLVTYGDVQRPQKFYEDKFLNAFPMALEMFSETSYSSAEDGARRCYFLRSLDQFAAFFGLAELKSESQELFQYSYVIGKSALLDRFVTFS